MKPVFIDLENYNYNPDEPIIENNVLKVPVIAYYDNDAEDTENDYVNAILVVKTGGIYYAKFPLYFSKDKFDHALQNNIVNFTLNIPLYNLNSIEAFLDGYIELYFFTYGTIKPADGYGLGYYYIPTLNNSNITKNTLTELNYNINTFFSADGKRKGLEVTIPEQLINILDNNENFELEVRYKYSDDNSNTLHIINQIITSETNINTFNFIAPEEGFRRESNYEDIYIKPTSMSILFFYNKNNEKNLIDIYTLNDIIVDYSLNFYDIEEVYNTNLKKCIRFNYNRYGDLGLYSPIDIFLEQNEPLYLKNVFNYRGKKGNVDSLNEEFIINNVEQNILGFSYIEIDDTFFNTISYPFYNHYEYFTIIGIPKGLYNKVELYKSSTFIKICNELKFNNIGTNIIVNHQYGQENYSSTEIEPFCLLPIGTDINIKVNKEGYYLYETNYQLNEDTIMDIILQPLPQQSLLNNIDIILEGQYNESETLTARIYSNLNTNGRNIIVPFDGQSHIIEFNKDNEDLPQYNISVTNQVSYENKAVDLTIDLNCEDYRKSSLINGIIHIKDKGDIEFLNLDKFNNKTIPLNIDNKSYGTITLNNNIEVSNPNYPSKINLNIKSTKEINPSNRTLYGTLEFDLNDNIIIDGEWSNFIIPNFGELEIPYVYDDEQKYIKLFTDINFKPILPQVSSNDEIVINNISKYFNTLSYTGYVNECEIHSLLVLMHLSDLLDKRYGNLTEEQITALYKLKDCLKCSSCYTTNISDMKYKE